jgi:hypothetical protein
LLPAAFALVLIGTLFLIARTPPASARERAATSSRYEFTELPIALPPGLETERSVRKVNAGYEDIRSWISSVGAAIAVNDLTGAGVAQDLCLVDTRSDTVIVTPVPGTGERYAPFVLDPAPLPLGPGVAPMGCNPGDFNQDGRMDLLAYYWGRTPVVFLNKQSTAGTLSKASYQPAELVPQAPAPDGSYHGPLWNTNAVAVADFDGDGHPDIGAFNYFPDSGVLDPNSPNNVDMNHSMSRAQNGGGAHVLRWTGATGGDRPSVSYQEQSGALDPEVASGWTLASASADLDGDLLPELYLANDFGKDRLLHNTSVPGRISFTEATGSRGPATPKSMVVGHDSFKGMAVDFGDLRGTGKFDMFVSNITTTWGIEESNFLWANQATSPENAREQLAGGNAPFKQEAAEHGMAFTGWGWDVKMADFDNSGRLAVVQADGFVKGEINRWPWLQELAMANDLMLEEPGMWPHARPGDDISGHEKLAFWAPSEDGNFLNISEDLGLAVPTPTRGVAVGDTDRDGAQDFAVARQWGAPAYYRNDKAGDGNFLGLRLHRPALGGDGSALAPAYGAQVCVKTSDGREQIAQLDGGGGHSGRRSFDVFFGLGEHGGEPVSAELSWRDNDGTVHRQKLSMTAGWHDLVLTDQAKEVRGR